MIFPNILLNLLDLAGQVYWGIKLIRFSDF